MRRLNKLITALLILLSAAGIVLAVLFLKKEQELETERQARVAKLSAELQPINEKRKEWQEQDKEWQGRLAEGKKGKTCVLLSFDNMSETLYETIYKMVDQYNFRATFALRNGMMPFWDEEELSYEEFEEMMHRGWEYALSIGEMPEQATEAEEDDWTNQEEQESETESETERPAKPKSFQSQMKEALALLEESGLEAPTTIFCTAEQYEEIGETVLARSGFQMAGVTDTESFPVIGERGEYIWKIDCGLYKQKDTDVSKVLAAAIDNGESVAIRINDIVSISKDSSYDLSMMKFSSLLNYLKGQEEQDRVNILTYSEYAQYQKEREREYKALAAEYAAFRQEMNDDIEVLNAMERAIVAESRSTEHSETTEESEGAEVTEAAETRAAEGAGTGIAEGADASAEAAGTEEQVQN